MTPLTEKLVEETGLPQHTLVRIMNRAPSLYKTYFIPKRSSGELREISQPAAEVKYVQRALVSVLLSQLPVHSAATAYQKGSSIRDNAARHAGDGPILKMDLKDFFPSLRSQDWISYCLRTGCLSDPVDLQLTSHLLFRRAKGHRVLRLAIGAPSSPILSNILMEEFDRRVVSSMENDRVSYTRYADDLTFSAPRTGYINGVERAVATVIRGLTSPKLDINKRKTTYVTRKYHRSVTGLTLANDGRVTIGHQKKREVRSMVHRAISNAMTRDELQVLAGVLAYIQDVEPAFLEVLARKYGPDSIREIKRFIKMGNQLEAHAPPIAPH